MGWRTILVRAPADQLVIVVQAGFDAPLFAERPYGSPGEQAAESEESGGEREAEGAGSRVTQGFIQITA